MIMANINPFVVHGHIPPELFCDRKEESEKLLHFLNNQQNVVLSAPRRMGKTKLVEFVFDKPEMSDKYITVFIDILETGNLREFIFSLGNAVFNRIAKRSERLMKLFTSAIKSLQTSFGYDPIQGMPTFDIKLGDLIYPEYTLKEIFSYIDQADKRCLIVIDEFQQICNYPEKNIEATLRTYIQKSKNANFVFAGSQRRIMSEMFGSEKRPFYNSAREIDLDAIDLSVYINFVQEQFKKATRSILPEAIEKVYGTFKGVTLYNQQIMNDAFDMAQDGEVIDLVKVDLLINDFIKENDKRIRELLYFVTDNQKEVLYAIASEGEVSGITSSAFTKKHRLKSPSSTQSALKSLLKSDLITRKNGLYSVSDPLMDLWLQKKVNKISI